MNQPFLSVAIPTFNRAKKLETQLSSLHKILSVSEFSSNIELVVVDNCSTDSTQDCIKQFACLEREYIFSSYKNKKNLGAERNFGQGILRSKGQFTWLLSDDDTVHKNAIDHIFNSLNKNQEVGFCFVNFDLDPTIGLPAIKVDAEDIISRSISEYFSYTMFADSMISSCIYVVGGVVGDVVPYAAKTMMYEQSRRRPRDRSGEGQCKNQNPDADSRRVILKSPRLRQALAATT